MAKYQTGDIRNVALIGHNESGKTTLAEAFLFKGGANIPLVSGSEPLHRIAHPSVSCYTHFRSR